MAPPIALRKLDEKNGKKASMFFLSSELEVHLFDGHLLTCTELHFLLHLPNCPQSNIVFSGVLISLCKWRKQMDLSTLYDVPVP